MGGIGESHCTRTSRMTDTNSVTRSTALDRGPGAVIVSIIPTGGYLRLWSIKPTLRMLHHEFGG